jgi:hypothetical protein
MGARRTLVDVTVCHPTAPEASQMSLLPPPDRLLSLPSFFSVGGAGAATVAHMQRGLTALAEQALGADQLAAASRRSQARILSLRGRHAGAWLTTLPTNQATTMHDEAFRIAMRFRLDLPPAERMPRWCACGYDLREDPWHHLSCQKLKATTITHRHDMVVQCSALWIKRAGGAAMVEPRQLDRSSNCHPDIDAVCGARRTLVDVTVCHPTAPSYVQLGLGLAALGTAKRREQDKHRKYDAMATRLNTRFCAFAVETYGAFGEEAQQFCKDVASFATLSCTTWPWKAVQRGMVNAISIAVQQGNAVAVLRGLQRSQGPGRRMREAVQRRRRRYAPADVEPEE